jgi:hypothetical protein
MVRSTAARQNDATGVPRKHSPHEGSAHSRKGSAANVARVDKRKCRRSQAAQASGRASAEPAGIFSPVATIDRPLEARQTPLQDRQSIL